MCKGKCGCKKSLGTITIIEEEKDLLVKLLNENVFNIKGLVLAHHILDKIDEAFPVKEE